MGARGVPGHGLLVRRETALEAEGTSTYKTHGTYKTTTHGTAFWAHQTDPLKTGLESNHSRKRPEDRTYHVKETGDV